MPNFLFRWIFSVLWMLNLFNSVFCDHETVTTNYVCPKRFVPIGRKCYHFSKDELTWHDAHFNCQNLNSTLATITRTQQELLIRQFLNKNNLILGRYERWLGGMFNEKQSKWVWGASGKSLIFHAFSRMNANDKTKWIWHCIIIDPARQNKWGARSCLHKKRYICQTPTNKYMTMKKRFKKNFDKNKCLDSNVGYEKELCSKIKFPNSTAPAFLRKKSHKKRLKPHHIEDFICPSHMILVGRKCYFFSVNQKTWMDAHYSCRENKTKLAIISNKMQDTILRGFLNKGFIEKRERWIGGIFDWKQNKWKWAMSGQVIKYRNFPKSVILNKDHTYHSISLDPRLDHRWNSVNRLEQRHYICQVKPKTLVKYERPQKIKPPDATVIIKIDNSDNLNNLKAPTTESSSPYHYSVTDNYIYN